MSSNSGANWNFGTRLGITFVVQAACSSALAVAGTLLFIGVGFQYFYHETTFVNLKHAPSIVLSTLTTGGGQ